MLKAQIELMDKQIDQASQEVSLRFPCLKPRLEWGRWWPGLAAYSPWTVPMPGVQPPGGTFCFVWRQSQLGESTPSPRISKLHTLTAQFAGAVGPIYPGPLRSARHCVVGVSWLPVEANGVRNEPSSPWPANWPSSCTACGAAANLSKLLLNRPL